MSFFDPIRIGASGAVADFSVDRSLRLNSDDNSGLSKSWSSSGDRRKWTWSCWAKFTDTTAASYFIGMTAIGNNREVFNRNTNGYIQYQLRVSGTPKAFVRTTAVFRDPSAWYHIVLNIDMDNSSSSERVKIYVNNVLQEVEYPSAAGVGGTPVKNTNTYVSSGTNYVGRTSDSYNSDMYLTECNFIDGQKYDPSYFGETNSETGQWDPKEYSGSYTGNSFYLKYDDNSDVTATTLGKDSSGLGNNWTPINLSVSAGTGNDSMKDTPSNNFATFNSAFERASNTSYKNGSLEFSTTSSGQKLARSTFAHDSGKWYAEFKLVSYSSASGSYPYIGVAPANKADEYGDHNTWVGYIGTAVNTAGAAYKNGSTISGGFTYAAGDIIGMAMDVDNLLVYFYKNGTIQNSGSGYALTSDSDKGYQFAVSLYASSGTWAANFGGIGIGSNSDANGHGNFTYAVPSGYLAECSANLSDPTILLPNKHFAAFTYTGTGSSGDVVNITNSNVDFTPDWVWVKTRDVTNDHILSDSVRGGTKYLVSSETYAEQTNTQKIRAFIENGFESGTDGDTNWTGSRPFVAWNWNAGDTDGKTYTVKVVSDSGNKYRFDDFGTSAVTLDLAEGGTYIFDQSDSSNSGHPLRFSTTSDGSHGGGTEYTTGVTTTGTAGSSGAKTTIVVAASAPTLYYYCTNHSGMGGQANTNTTLGSSNFDGSVQSTVKVNASAGFSIVLFSGSGNRTIGHGLGVAPRVIIMKGRNVTDQWTVGHQQLDASNPWHKGLPLNTNATTQDNATFWNDTAPTSTVFSKGSWNENYNMVALCFSEVSGYSKFGKYEGNGSSDGTFVFTGFKPAWVMVRRTDDTDNWGIYDIARDTTNVMGSELFAATSSAEQSNSSDLDFVSNGFKFRRNYTSNNGSGTFIYLAFAESPFKNARAR